MREFKAAPVLSINVRAGLGESPLWDRAAGLRWLDIEGRLLFTLSLSGTITSIPLSETVKAIERSRQGDLLAVTCTGFAWLDPESGRIENIASVVDGRAVIMNDGAIDNAGRCWAGSVVRDGSWRGQLFCLEGSETSIHLEQLGMSNGIDWSPSGDVLYHVDSTAGTITAWKYDVNSAKLGCRYLLRTIPSDIGIPDGLNVDHEGNIWLAIWGAGQIWCLDPYTGKTNMIVQVPTPYTTSCAFGGPDLSTLYITTANYQNPPGGGRIYVANVAVRGREPNRFVGATS